METKQELRSKIKSQLKNLNETDIEVQTQDLSLNLYKLLNELGIIQEKSVIGFFASIAKEPKWTAEFLDQFKEVSAYPAFGDGEMVFKKSSFTDLIVVKDFGPKILGPKKSSEVVRPKVVIVPGLAFGLKGERLGRGGGFYDRYLQNAESIKIGVCFETQILDTIPLEEHDVKVDYLVTNQVIKKIEKKLKEFKI